MKFKPTILSFSTYPTSVVFNLSITLKQSVQNHINHHKLQYKLGANNQYDYKIISIKKNYIFKAEIKIFTKWCCNNLDAFRHGTSSNYHPTIHPFSGKCTYWMSSFLNKGQCVANQAQPLETADNCPYNHSQN